MSALDGRKPLVLDVRELQRRAGAMMRIQRTAPAPMDLENPMIGIPVDADLDLDLMAESVIEGVLISGTVSAQAVGSCSRCLTPISEPIEVSIQELFRHADLAADDPDDDLPTFEEDLIDLEPTLRDAVVLSLPLAPVCDPDCPGLCTQCGVQLKDNPGHHHTQTDPRWDALSELFNEKG